MLCYAKQVRVRVRMRMLMLTRCRQAIAPQPASLQLTHPDHTTLSGSPAKLKSSPCRMPSPAALHKGSSVSAALGSALGFPRLCLSRYARVLGSASPAPPSSRGLWERGEGAHTGRWQAS